MSEMMIAGISIFVAGVLVFICGVVLKSDEGDGYIFIGCILCVIGFFVMLSCVWKNAESEHSVYPLTVQVVELDHEADVVVCVDGAGNSWEFYGVEDWQVGDFASLLMDDNGTTENIYDDVITTAHYAGTFEG